MRCFENAVNPKLFMPQTIILVNFNGFDVSIFQMKLSPNMEKYLSIPFMQQKSIK